MKILLIIAAALTALVGVRVAFGLEVGAVVAACCLVASRAWRDGWRVIPRGAA